MLYDTGPRCWNNVKFPVWPKSIHSSFALKRYAYQNCRNRHWTFGPQKSVGGNFQKTLNLVTLAYKLHEAIIYQLSILHCMLFLSHGIRCYFLRSWFWATTTVWPVKSRQMSIKLLKNDFTRKGKILTPLQKLPKKWPIWAKQLLP